MADKQSTKEPINENPQNLPNLPKPISLLRRLFMSPRIYNENLRRIAEALAAVEEREAAVEEREAAVKKREEAVAEIEAVVEREAEVAQREEEVAQREEEVAEKEKVLAEREKAIVSKENLAELTRKQSEKRIANFREDNNVPPEISDEALNRDMAVKQVLAAINKKIESFNQTFETANSVAFTDNDKYQLKKHKLMLKAALLGAVCFYRDSLPSEERPGFTINGKTSTLFLQELGSQIITEGKNLMILSSNAREKLEETRVNYDLYLPSKLIEQIERAYKNCSHSSNMDFYPVDDKDYYRYADFIHRVGSTILVSCLNARNYGLKVYSEQQRATTDNRKQSDLEEQISETGNALNSNNPNSLGKSGDNER